MSTLYWISVLGNLQTLAVVLCSISGTIFFISLLFIIIYSDSSFPSEKQTQETAIDITKCSLPVLLLGILLAVFIPTKEELYLIYGVGGTIDYLKSNDTAKQLPDKTIQVLDKWVNSYLEEDNEE